MVKIMIDNNNVNNEEDDRDGKDNMMWTTMAKITMYM
jgi:hypothetical protein